MRVQGIEVRVKEQGAPRLKVGMRLCIDSFGYGSDWIVQRVEGQEATVLELILRGSAPDAKPIKPGTTLTTGNYWHRPRGTGGK